MNEVSKEREFDECQILQLLGKSNDFEKQNKVCHKDIKTGIKAAFLELRQTLGFKTLFTI